ncbi:putative transcription factor [Hibiscus syriacus]|uniref:Transcription factor n=1 Tax=Hibiscus syriacus TaxID=106335 RepID=A0A6A3AQB4_HIBSY|nr:putative transcription factor [Hibiscus syriacus]
MGCGSSKADKNEALRLCKERRFIKQAIDSRYALAAAHVSYIQSFRNIGLALRRLAEADILIESSRSTLATELDKTPSPSSYPSPSPSHLGADSPLNNESPISPEMANLSYMKAGKSAGVTFMINPSFVEDEFERNNGMDVDFEDSREFRNTGIDHGDIRQRNGKKVRQLCAGNNVNEPGETLIGKCVLEQSSSKREKGAEDDDLSAEKADPSEFITHRAKDFLSSIKVIEHRFFRASEAGKEVSKMLESNKIRVGYFEGKGGSSTFMAAFRLVCCRRNTALVSHESVPRVTKVVHWKRSASWRSSSSRNPLTKRLKTMLMTVEVTSLKSSAWLLASESIWKEYDRKCDRLRLQFAKDLNTQVIDKTRAVVKGLHSVIRVALHSVNTVSKRIEKMRDEELQPQLVELIQGLLRMWNVMLECHHSQYITISLAYHTRNSTGALKGHTHRQIMAQLRQGIECFGVSFTDWINSHVSYLEALNGWMQNCIIEPREHSKNRYPFSPRLDPGFGPPIYVLCHEWSAAVKALPAEELRVAIKTFLSDICHQTDLSIEQPQKKEKSVDTNKGDPKIRDGVNVLTDGNTNDDASSNLRCIQTSMTRLLDRLTRFSEASVKMFEDVRQKSEAARITYLKLQAN